MRDTFFRRNRAAMIILLSVLVIGAGYLLYSVCSLVYCQHMITNMPAVTAKVTSVKSRRRKGETTTKTYVSYTVNGVDYYNVYVAHPRYVREKGAALQIHYDPANPNRVVASDQEYAWRIIAGAGGICLLIFAIIQIRGVKRQDARKQHPLGEGIHIQATVTRVIKVSKRAKERPLIKIECEYYNTTAKCARYVPDAGKLTVTQNLFVIIPSSL